MAALHRNLFQLIKAGCRSRTILSVVTANCVTSMKNDRNHIRPSNSRCTYVVVRGSNRPPIVLFVGCLCLAVGTFKHCNSWTVDQMPF